MLSIGIPCHNEARNIGALLDDLRKQSFVTDYEIVVVDDCSVDSTAEIVTRASTLDSRIRLVRHEKRSGSTAAWNTIFRNARGAALLKIDGDVRLPDHAFVTKMTEPLLRRAIPSDVTYCAVLPRTLPTTWVERGSGFIYSYIAEQNRRGNFTPESLFCAVVGLRRQAYEAYEIPEDIIANDYYTARHAYARLWRIEIVETTATIKPATSLADFRKQARRAATAHVQVDALLGKNPPHYRKSVPAILTCAIRDPLGTASFLRLRREIREDAGQSTAWEAADSTK